MQTRPMELPCRAMKPYLTGCVALAVLFLVLGVPGAAQALCTDLGGTPTATECLITSAQNKSGAFTIEGTLTLHFVNSGGGSVGSITTGGADLSITGQGGLVMDAGTFIDANKTGGVCPTGGTVDLTFAGDVTIKPGSIIRSDSCSGGTIHIKGGQNVDINGLLSSFGSNKSAFSATQIAPGGGPITVETLCNLTVTPEGVISSRGKDSGADLVQLVGGCFVKVFGLVESTGGGHRVPNTPPNHCGPAFRPGKPADSIACVEIIAGDLLVVDAVAPNNGEINVDTGGVGGGGSAWADLFARGPIQIIGDVNPPFAVHANGLSGANDIGGTITVKSRDQSVSAIGLAFQADALKGGGSGGVVVVEAKTSVTLDDSQILARGDFGATNGFGTGGQISGRAWQAFLNWRDTATAPLSIGDVRPTGTDIPVGQRGSITLVACTTLSTTGTSFPVNGAAVPPFPATTTGSCGAGPSFPAYIVFPDCTCVLACP